MPKAKGSSYRVSRPRGVLPGSVAKAVRSETTKKEVAGLAKAFRQARKASPGKVSKKEKQLIRHTEKIVAGHAGGRPQPLPSLRKRAKSTYTGKKGGKKKGALESK